MSTGNLVVLSAPSGTGKTSVCKNLLKRNPNWKFSVSATTRPLRDDEVDGKDYIQMTNEKFEHFVKFGDFLEWMNSFGSSFGLFRAAWPSAFWGLPRGTERSVAVGQVVDKVSFWRPSAWAWAQKRRAAWPA